MKLLVMGGTEFVSKSIAKYFISKDYTVDIFTRGQKKLDYVGVNVHHIGNRKFKDELKVLKSISYDYIIDISAYTLEDVKLLTDIVETSNLKRYVFCSSGAVYKPSTKLMDEKFDRGENNNWLKYGLDKLEAENYLFNLHKEKAFPVTMFRPTYIYGPNNNLYRESYFFDCISRNVEIPYPDSNNQTQFIQIFDLVRIIESMMTNEISNGEAYNVTHESKYMFKDVIEVFENVTSKSVKAIPVDTSVFKVARTYFPYRDVTYLLSIDKLRSHNLYLPKYDLFDGLFQTYSWYETTRPQLTDKSMSQINEIIEHYKN